LIWSAKPYIGVSKVPRVLRGIIADYFKRYKIKIIPSLEVDNYAMAINCGVG